MFKKLAILGHETRNEEVIELLKMLGGMDTFGFSCTKTDRFYHVSPNDGFVYWDYNDPSIVENKFEVFTLEKFLEKFPFKVGDFVRIPEYESEVCILKMKWCPLCEYIEYLVCPNDEDEWFTADELLEDNDNPTKTRDCKKCGLHFGSVRCFDKDCPHNTPKSYAVGLKDGEVIECGVNKDTDMNKNNREVIDMTKETITPTPDITADVTDKNNCGIQCPDGYEFYDENGNLIGNKVMMRPKKPKYPTTYEECYDEGNTELHFIYVDKDERDLYESFIQLIRCRNAYWKIAGKQMGLGKPWEPKYEALTDNTFFTIQTFNGEIDKSATSHRNSILVFPTIEMRDAFYENFKDLIECCKELL